MCKYCEEKEDLISNNNNGLHVLSITNNEGICTLDMGTPLGLFSKEINYCSICGRKLGE